MASTLPERFFSYIQQQRLFHQQHRLLVAVSGGLDSAVLCHLLQGAGYCFAIAHCHFGLRGAESDRDADFVQGLAAHYGVPFFLRRFQTEVIARVQKLSVQEAARKLRYDWFRELVGQTQWDGEKDGPNPVAETPGYDLLLTAHHLDDNVETVAMNFFKGTGISGLRGMMPLQGFVARPLLFARRAELEAYANAQNLHWVEDSSNTETKYTRNFFRHQVLPLVEQKMPQAFENMAENISRFSEIEQIYMAAIETHRRNLLEQRGEEWHIAVLKLLKTTPLATIAYELLKPFGFGPQQTGAVLQLLHSDSGRYVRSATHQVVRHRRWLVVAPLQADTQNLLLIEDGQEKVAFENRLIHLEQTDLPKTLPAEPTTALLDVRELQFPLVLRRWRQGDYFYPLGLAKKKKVSRFLIDLKLSKTEKERVWVLESGKRIAWVTGLRIDDRFKVTPGTKTVLKLTLSPSTEATSGHH